MTTAPPPNRLARETSPYLLQHAHNPVDWYPWGDEAFAEARRRDVPIFLSIGYSTCYWCHVMERECFEDGAIARSMNHGFVCIKADREERPDVDELYMAATQLLTGHGGWPMSVFLEPASLRPFFAGTYFPPEPRHGMPSFPQLLEAMSNAWRTRRAEVIEQSAVVAEGVRQHAGAEAAPVGLGLEQVSAAAGDLLRRLDRVNGGFGSAPKFPQPSNLELLLDIRAAAADDATRDATDRAVRLTLDRMATGGLHDQVGGGFHRYSVDERWLVPHFEKMLYDNAQLAAVYARAGATCGDEYYKSVARRTLEYVLREMTSAEGAFYSAQDAEAQGHEGGNYVWTAEELRETLPPDLAGIAAEIYGLSAGPNFRDPHHPEAPPSNVLFVRERPERLSADAAAKLPRINSLLYAAREKRPQPLRDDKVIAGWNGLMIAAMARAGRDVAESRYLDAAERAAAFITGRMRSKDGLLRTWRAGTAKTPAFLEDYAFLIGGLLALTGAGRGRVDVSVALVTEAERLFGDGSGGFYDTRDRQPDLFVRPRSTYDGALPSGASVMLQNYIALHGHTRDGVYLDKAVAVLASLSAAIARSPASMVTAVRGLLALTAEGATLLNRVSSLGPAPAAAPPRNEFTPVEVYASEERVQVGRDRPARLELVIRIAPGYHITASEPGPGAEGLVPLRVGIVGGGGVTAYADYPPGEPYGPAGEVRIHRDSVAYPVAIERAGEWSGRPLLAVTYQACTDAECLAPVTVELSVAIDRLD